MKHVKTFEDFVTNTDVVKSDETRLEEGILKGLFKKAPKIIIDTKDTIKKIIAQGLYRDFGVALKKVADADFIKDTKQWWQDAGFSKWAEETKIEALHLAQNAVVESVDNDESIDESSITIKNGKGWDDEGNSWKEDVVPNGHYTSSEYQSLKNSGGGRRGGMKQNSRSRRRRY